MLHGHLEPVWRDAAGRSSRLLPGSSFSPVQKMVENLVKFRAVRDNGRKGQTNWVEPLAPESGSPGRSAFSSVRRETVLSVSGCVRPAGGHFDDQSRPEAAHASWGEHEAAPSPRPRRRDVGGRICIRVRRVPVEGTRVNGDGIVSSADARAILNDLIRQRQRMRDTEPNPSLVEANRLAIVYWQWQLTRALDSERGGTAAVA